MLHADAVYELNSMKSIANEAITNTVIHSVMQLRDLSGQEAESRAADWVGERDRSGLWGAHTADLWHTCQNSTAMVLCTQVKYAALDITVHLAIKRMGRTSPRACSMQAQYTSAFLCTVLQSPAQETFQSKQCLGGRKVWALASDL